MKWYKRDPDAALIGMRGLSHDAKSAYGTIIDLSYSRDGDLPADDHLLCVHIECRPQWWRRVKAELIAAGKIREIDGKLIANRVETTLKEAANFAQTQAKRATNGWVSRKKTNKNNDTPLPLGNANTTTTTVVEEGKEPSSTSSRSNAKPRSRARRPVCEFPADWTPADLQPAEQAEFARFRDSAHAHARRYADWPAAWRNWKSSPYQQTGGSNGSLRLHPGPAESPITAAANRLRQRMGIIPDRNDPQRLPQGRLPQPGRVHGPSGDEPVEIPAGNYRICKCANDGNSNTLTMAPKPRRNRRRV